MSSSAKPDRPNRLVMALGIATIVLFSVNLLAMLSQRVWPKLQDLAIFGSGETVEEVVPNVDTRVEIIHRSHNKMAFSYITKFRKKKRCYRRHEYRSQEALEEDIERSLELDMNRLERQIEREMKRLNSELSDATSNLEETISLELSINGPNSILVRRKNLDMSELEENVAAVTRKFEVRVREFEEAARKKQKVVKERSY